MKHQRVHNAHGIGEDMQRFRLGVAAMIIALPFQWPLTARVANAAVDSPSVTPAYVSDSRGRVIGPLVAPTSTPTMAAALAALWRSPWGNIKVQFLASDPAESSAFGYLASPPIYFTSIDCAGPGYVMDADLMPFVPGFSRAFVADDVAGTFTAPGPTVGTVYQVATTGELIAPRGVRRQLGLSCIAMSGTPVQMFKLKALGRFDEHFVGPFVVK